MEKGICWRDNTPGGSSGEAGEGAGEGGGNGVGRGRIGVCPLQIQTPNGNAVFGISKGRKQRRRRHRPRQAEASERREHLGGEFEDLRAGFRKWRNGSQRKQTGTTQSFPVQEIEGSAIVPRRDHTRP